MLCNQARLSMGLGIPIQPQNCCWNLISIVNDILGLLAWCSLETWPDKMEEKGCNTVLGVRAEASLVAGPYCPWESKDSAAVGSASALFDVSLLFIAPLNKLLNTLLWALISQNLWPKSSLAAKKSWRNDSSESVDLANQWLVQCKAHVMRGRPCLTLPIWSGTGGWIAQRCRSKTKHDWQKKNKQKTKTTITKNHEMILYDILLYSKICG